MKLNIAKTRVVSYTRKTDFLSYDYQLCHAIITRISSIKDLGVFFDSKLHFHTHVNYIFSEWIKLLGFRINAHNTDINALSGIQTHDLSVRTSEGISCLRPSGHCGRLLLYIACNN
ncbi:hypothetical protein B7P43_G00527 [Cryptotermes secundus]|uniref:Reverse transcriptase domain-containing protein n=1 Tax=Cryptotermes secundus TaxID=105785 RepID=A0A2J7R691_9NEOP|nr:hypothetical protein B7P43_G00527 [Cryptotermes secundus]